MEKLLVNAEEAAAMLSLSRATIYNELASGRLESIHVGRARRIPVDSIIKWIEDRRAEEPRSTITAQTPGNIIIGAGDIYRDGGLGAGAWDGPGDNEPH